MASIVDTAPSQSIRTYLMSSSNLYSGFRGLKTFNHPRRCTTCSEHMASQHISLGP